MPDVTAPDVTAFPRGVADPLCPREHVIETTTDHRLLWHIRSALAVSATNDDLRELGRDVGRYLTETCQHHWHGYEPEPDIPAHSQCLWCNDVIWHQPESAGGTGEMATE